MDAQASSQFRSDATTEQQRGGAVESPPARETSQAERAAMHPEPHEIEWPYYFGALNNPVLEP